MATFQIALPEQFNFNQPDERPNASGMRPDFQRKMKSIKSIL